MNPEDYQELKKGGMMRQREAGFFSVRLHVVGGKLTSIQMRAIQVAADCYGRGEVHLTSRQGVEIPFVRAAYLSTIKEFLAPSGVGIGVCGPTVRTVTACQGCRVCTSGVIDAPVLAEAVDREFYGKPVPHKFKVGISGCANNCIKAEENDTGVKGWVEPLWSRGPCTSCGICEAVCPSKAIEVSKDAGTVSISLDECIGCGDCIEACPTQAMETGRKGYRLYAGGKFGRIPVLGRRILGVLRGPEEVVAAIRAVLEFFREEGRPMERFADTLQRTGTGALESRIADKGRRTA